MWGTSSSAVNNTGVVKSIHKYMRFFNNDNACYGRHFLRLNSNDK